MIPKNLSWIQAVSFFEDTSGVATVGRSVAVDETCIELRRVATSLSRTLSPRYMWILLYVRLFSSSALSNMSERELSLLRSYCYKQQTDGIPVLNIDHYGESLSAIVVLLSIELPIKFWTFKIYQESRHNILFPAVHPHKPNAFVRLSTKFWVLSNY